MQQRYPQGEPPPLPLVTVHANAVWRYITALFGRDLCREVVVWTANHWAAKLRSRIAKRPRLRCSTRLPIEAPAPTEHGVHFATHVHACGRQAAKVSGGRAAKALVDTAPRITWVHVPWSSIDLVG